MSEQDKKRIMDALYQLYVEAGQFKTQPKKLEDYFELSNIGLTSLTTLVLIMNIEEYFKIKIDLMDFLYIKTINGLVTYIYNKEQETK